MVVINQLIQLILWSSPHILTFNNKEIMSTVRSTLLKSKETIPTAFLTCLYILIIAWGKGVVRTLNWSVLVNPWYYLRIVALVCKNQHQTLSLHDSDFLFWKWSTFATVSLCHPFTTPLFFLNTLIN